MVKTVLLTQKTASNGAKILEPAKVLVDSRERISIAYLKDYFEVMEIGDEVDESMETFVESGLIVETGFKDELRTSKMPAGDIFFKDESKLIELKIGKDVRGITQLHKECLQMYVWHNQRLEKFGEEQELHACCCHITREDIVWENERRKKAGLPKTKMKPYIISLEEFQTFVHFTDAYSIHPHLCKSIQKMMFKLREIRTAIYRPKMFIPGLKLPSTCAKWWNACPGISPEKAVMIADRLDNIPWNIFTMNIPKILDEVYELKKDGGRKKIVEKTLSLIKNGEPKEEKK